MQRPGSLMLEPRRASQTQDESHTRPNLGKGRAGCVVPDVTPGRTLTQHNPVSHGGVFYCALSTELVFVFTTAQLMTLAAQNCLQPMVLSSWSWIVLCFLARHDRTLLASQCEFAL